MGKQRSNEKISGPKWPASDGGAHENQPTTADVAQGRTERRLEWRGSPGEFYSVILGAIVYRK